MEHFLFFLFFFWKIFCGAKFFKPKLCLHTKYALTQCTAKSAKRISEHQKPCASKTKNKVSNCLNRQSTFWAEDATQGNPFASLARTALFYIAAVPKNLKPFTGPFTHSGKMDSFTRTFAAQSLKCFDFQTWKNCCCSGSNLALKEQPKTRNWLTKSNPPGNWSKKCRSNPNCWISCGIRLSENTISVYKNKARQ